MISYGMLPGLSREEEIELHNSQQNLQEIDADSRGEAKGHATEISPALRNRESCQPTIMAVTSVAITSEAGKAAHIPSRPNFGGSNSNRGMRKSTWRVSDRKMEAEAFPIDWKSVVETIWKPTTVNAIKDM